jgi:hypothetical protein
MQTPYCGQPIKSPLRRHKMLFRCLEDANLSALPVESPGSAENRALADAKNILSILELVWAQRVDNNNNRR